MLEILTRAGCYVAIILLGIVLRTVGFFKEEDFRVLSRIVIRITLPAAIISSAAGREIAPQLLTISAIGLGGGILYMVLGYLTGRKGGKDQKAFCLLNLPGYNIGNFALPFTQSFLGPTGVLVSCLFDVGNAFVCLGGAHGVAQAIKAGNGFDWKRVVKALSRSVPFLVHILVVSMNLLHIPLPGAIVSCAGIIGNANAFLAMLMIGVGFKLELEREKLGILAKILLLRYAVAALMALGCYYLLPFDLEVRQTLVLLVVSPIGSAVPGFTEEIKGDVGLSCSINSLAILISVLLTVVLLVVML